MAKGSKKGSGKKKPGRPLSKRKQSELFKERSERAKKGWRTRREDGNGIYERMVKWLKIFKESGSLDQKAYAQFRMNKRFLFEVMGDAARDIAAQAAEEAGWLLETSMRFSRLS